MKILWNHHLLLVQSHEVPWKHHLLMVKSNKKNIQSHLKKKKTSNPIFQKKTLTTSKSHLKKNESDLKKKNTHQIPYKKTHEIPLKPSVQNPHGPPAEISPPWRAGVGHPLATTQGRWDRALDLAHAFLAVQGYDFGGYELCMAFIIFEWIAYESIIKSIIRCIPSFGENWMVSY